MAHELDGADRTEVDKSDKKFLKRRGYIKAGAAVAAVVAWNGTGVVSSASEDGTSDAFETGFGEYSS